MKKAMVLLFMAMFGAAANAEVLMKYYKGASFGPQIMATTIEVATDGKVSTSKHDFQTGETTVTPVATLAPLALEAINNKLKYLDASAGVEDQTPDEDRCSDFPEVAVWVLKDGVETKIFKASACHDFKIKNGSANE